MAFPTIGNPPSTQPLVGLYNIDQMPSLTYQAGAYTSSSVSDLLTATGTNQATALQLVATTNRFTTVASGTGALLQTATGGLAIRVINSGANNLAVYPATGASINGNTANLPYILGPNSTAEFYGSDATNWQTNYSNANPLPTVLYTAINNTSSFTLTGPQMAGVADMTINLTGTLAGASTVTTPTATQILAAINNSTAASSYNLRIINSSSGAFTWTLAAGTGVTLSGTMTMAQNTWRDFYVNATSLSAITIQSIGTGTQS